RADETAPVATGAAGRLDPLHRRGHGDVVEGIPQCVEHLVLAHGPTSWSLAVPSSTVTSWPRNADTARDKWAVTVPSAIPSPWAVALLSRSRKTRSAIPSRCRCGS